jgi:hypothetical protein
VIQLQICGASEVDAVVDTRPGQGYLVFWVVFSWDLMGFFMRTFVDFCDVKEKNITIWL